MGEAVKIEFMSGADGGNVGSRCISGFPLGSARSLGSERPKCQELRILDS